MKLTKKQAEALEWLERTPGRVAGTMVSPTIRIMKIFESKGLATTTEWRDEWLITEAGLSALNQQGE